MYSYSLDDDIVFSGCKIVRFSYKNTEIPVISWIEMLEQVLRILHAEDKSILIRLAYSQDTQNDLNVYVSNNPNKLRAAIKIDSDIFVERNTSTATKLSMLRKFFKLYGANEEDLIFYLKSIDEY